MRVTEKAEGVSSVANLRQAVQEIIATAPEEIGVARSPWNLIERFRFQLGRISETHPHPYAA